MKLTIDKSATEDLLIEGCLQNSPSAQKAVYERYSPKMYAICIRYVGDSESAKDILIQGFLKVLNKIGQFKREGSFEGWIRRIIVNESLTYLRKNKFMHLEVDLETAEREPDYNFVQNTFEADELIALVNLLPPGYKTVFNLFAIEGYSHKEIAEMMGINENTSKSQLSRARKHLQELLLKREINVDLKFTGNE
ncbi:MAG TPA: sigma-70 family RNA polymerase sigma factor [Cyclobacteriaceae bacterium]|jgi:RNA polymerase sigma-70 factor (ECF subfamily)